MNELNKKPIRKFTEMTAPAMASEECEDARIPDCKIKGWATKDIEHDTWDATISLNGDIVAALSTTKGKWYAIQMLRGAIYGLSRYIANKRRKKAKRRARKADAVTANPPLSRDAPPAFFTPAAVAKLTEAELRKDGDIMTKKVVEIANQMLREAALLDMLGNQALSAQKVAEKVRGFAQGILSALGQSEGGAE